MPLRVISSGSRGNSLALYNRGVCLIDVGVSWKKLRSAIEEDGYAMDDIRSVFITHSHSDHISGLRVLLGNINPVIYTTAATAEYIRKWYASELKQLKRRDSYPTPEELDIRIIEPLRQYDLSGLRFTALPLYHDAPSTVGFRIFSPVDMAVITDTGTIDGTILESILDTSMLLLEANHNPDMLSRSSYPLHLQLRISGNRGHLSNHQTREILRHVLSENDKLDRVILGHVSANANTPEQVWIDVVEPLQYADIGWYVIPNGQGTGLIE